MATLRWIRRVSGSVPVEVDHDLLAALRTGAFSFQHAAHPLLELGFDGERREGRADLRPVLPLVLLW